MITTLALPLALAAGGALQGSDRPLALHGECIYPPKIAEALPDAVQVICDTVEVTAGGVDFQRRGWDAHTRFFGNWQGSIMTVTAIQPRNERRAEARGSCRIDYANNEISLVSCSAFGRGRGWVANFRNVRP
jgi:hypothetical protein